MRDGDGDEMKPGAAFAFATAAAASSTLYYLFENKFRSSCGAQTHVHAHSPNALYICFMSLSWCVCVGVFGGVYNV